MSTSLASKRHQHWPGDHSGRVTKHHGIGWWDREWYKVNMGFISRVNWVEHIWGVKRVIEQESKSGSIVKTEELWQE